MNDAEGITNGFYMGLPMDVARLMSTFDHYIHFAHLHRDYERLVKASMEYHKLERRLMEMPFCKVRASKKIHCNPRFPSSRKIYLKDNFPHLEIA